MNAYSLITAKSLAALNMVLAGKARKFLLKLTEAFILAVFLFLIYARYFASVPGLAVRTIGAMAILLAFWIFLMLLDSYARSYDSDHEPYWLEAYAIAERGKYDGNYLRVFIQSRAGYEVLLRLGLDAEKIDALASSRQPEHSAGVFAPSGEACVSFVLLAKELFLADERLRTGLFGVAVNEKEFSGAVAFVVDSENTRRQAERWWTSDALGKIKCIGKDWAYGDTFHLDRYSEDLTRAYFVESDEIKSVMHAEEIKQIESALSRQEETNVLLVGHPGAGVVDIVKGLADKIKAGKTTAQLSHKRTILFRGVSLVSGSKEKSVFESEFIRIMNEAAGAGNVLLAFDDFGSFFASAQAIGSDVTALMAPYLASFSIQIIALCNASQFHDLFEGNQALMAKFEKIIISEPDYPAVVRLVSRMGAEMEARTGLTFTYPALLAVVDCAEQYITDGVMPDKALDLLVDLSSALVRDHEFFVSKDDVLQFVKLKTNVPVGSIGSDEREKLERLEQCLHERVVGQNEAITAVSDALRRVRSGIKNPHKPIGTFLFLGPTGVGKTETAKALAAAYFGNESDMMRLDMNQYKETDAIDKLIGSFGAGRPGILTSMIRDKKYGVLLLDEFEKASDNVKDLFLQMLDEGVFADASGEKVNARNIIFIATSNAGSDEIFRIAQAGGKLSDHRDELVNQMIATGIMKPELLNRFDGVIFFEPLSKENIVKIASMILGKLRSRLREKGIDFVINQPTIDAVVNIGYDPKFGARPMNRAVQDKIEGLIARKIIAGELPAGSKIELAPADLA